MKLFYALLAHPKSSFFSEDEGHSSSETPKYEEITPGHIAKDNNLINNTPPVTQRDAVLSWKTDCPK